MKFYIPKIISLKSHEKLFLLFFEEIRDNEFSLPKKFISEGLL